jgi:hypothetical protein
MDPRILDLVHFLIDAAGVTVLFFGTCLGGVVLASSLRLWWMRRQERDA